MHKHISSAPLDMLSRVCVRECRLDDGKGNVVDLDKNTTVMIHANAVHLDPNFYDEPNKFNPENFNKENRANRSP